MVKNLVPVSTPKGREVGTVDMIAHDTITFQSLGRLQVLGGMLSCLTQQDAKVDVLRVWTIRNRNVQSNAQPTTFPFGYPANENNGKVSSLIVKKVTNCNRTVRTGWRPVSADWGPKQEWSDVTLVRRRQSATDPRVFNLDSTLYMKHPLYFFVTVW